MHNNYHFFKYLVPELEAKIKNQRLLASFSQQKDELILGFGTADSDFYIKASLLPQISALSFSDVFHRTKKNSVDLFSELIGAKVTGCYLYLNERCFHIALENDWIILFKMHGSRSNILIFHADECAYLFKNSLPEDRNIQLSSLDRPIGQSKEALELAQGKISQVFPTFGKIPQAWIQQKSASHSIDHVWVLVEECLREMEANNFFIVIWQDQIHLSLLPIGEILKKPDSAIEAANDYFYSFVRGFSLDKEKKHWIRLLEKKLEQSSRYIEKTSKRLDELNAGTSNEELGHLLMANMHAIPKGIEEVVLESFYTGEKVKIKLKKELSPQKNAENYYRKSKNEKIEKATLEENLLGRMESVDRFKHLLDELKEVEDLKMLRLLIKEQGLEKEIKEEEVVLPYKVVDFEGFRILIGKNARSNDILTQRYAWKEDLWLHAKDVSGSHVVIKHQAGKNFPKSVIERAAELAAYHSKRRTESLCPVIFTPRKFVRKTRDLLPGQVIVDKEEVVMVPPKP